MIDVKHVVEDVQDLRTRTSTSYYSKIMQGKRSHRKIEQVEEEEARSTAFVAKPHEPPQSEAKISGLFQRTDRNRTSITQFCTRLVNHLKKVFPSRRSEKTGYCDKLSIIPKKTEDKRNGEIFLDDTDIKKKHLIQAATTSSGEYGSRDSKLCKMITEVHKTKDRMKTFSIVRIQDPSLKMRSCCFNLVPLRFLPIIDFAEDSKGVLEWRTLPGAQHSSGGSTTTNRERELSGMDNMGTELLELRMGNPGGFCLDRCPYEICMDIDMKVVTDLLRIVVPSLWKWQRRLTVDTQQIIHPRYPSQNDWSLQYRPALSIRSLEQEGRVDFWAEQINEFAVSLWNILRNISQMTNPHKKGTIGGINSTASSIVQCETISNRTAEFADFISWPKRENVCRNSLYECYGYSLREKHHLATIIKKRRTMDLKEFPLQGKPAILQFPLNDTEKPGANLITNFNKKISLPQSTYVQGTKYREVFILNRRTDPDGHLDLSLRNEKFEVQGGCSNLSKEPPLPDSNCPMCQSTREELQSPVMVKPFDLDTVGELLMNSIVKMDSLQKEVKSLQDAVNLLKEENKELKSVIFQLFPQNNKNWTPIIGQGLENFVEHEEKSIKQVKNVLYSDSFLPTNTASYCDKKGLILEIKNSTIVSDNNIEGHCQADDSPHIAAYPSTEKTRKTFPREDEEVHTSFKRKSTSSLDKSVSVREIGYSTVNGGEREEEVSTFSSSEDDAFTEETISSSESSLSERREQYFCHEGDNIVSVTDKMIMKDVKLLKENIDFNLRDLRNKTRKCECSLTEFRKENMNLKHDNDRLKREIDELKKLIESSKQDLCVSEEQSGEVTSYHKVMGWNNITDHSCDNGVQRPCGHSNRGSNRRYDLTCRNNTTEQCIEQQNLNTNVSIKSGKYCYKDVKEREKNLEFKNQYIEDWLCKEKTTMSHSDYDSSITDLANDDTQDSDRTFRHSTEGTVRKEEMSEMRRSYATRVFRKSKITATSSSSGNVVERQTQKTVFPPSKK